MGYLSNLFKKNKIQPFTELALENQNGKIENVSISDLEKFLRIMLDDSDQFIILKPMKRTDNISYVQACQLSAGKITVQVGLIIMISGCPRTKLVEEVCSPKECEDIFRLYFESGIVNNIDEYEMTAVVAAD